MGIKYDTILGKLREDSTEELEARIAAVGQGGADITVVEDPSADPPTHTVSMATASSTYVFTVSDGERGPQGSTGPEGPTGPTGPRDTYTEITPVDVGSLVVEPGQVVSWAVPASGGSLSASGGSAGSRAYAALDIDLVSSGLVELDSSLQWASPLDGLRAGVVNHCVVIWNGTAASLAQTDPEASIDSRYAQLADSMTVLSSEVSSKMDEPASAGTSGQVLTMGSDGYRWDDPQGVAEVSWGGISGTLSSQSDLTSALASKADLDSAGKVLISELPVAGPWNGSDYPAGLVKLDNSVAIVGLNINSSGGISIQPASTNWIAGRSAALNTPIVPGNLNYAVTAALTDEKHITLASDQQAVAKGVLGVVDPAPVDTALNSSSANPVANSAVCQGLSSKVDVSAVGSAGGVASLDSAGKVPSAELPLAKVGNQSAIDKKGIISVYPYESHALNLDNGTLFFQSLRETNAGHKTLIDQRTSYTTAIGPASLNYAVTAALTDANHITLTDAQKATAQSVLGASPAPIVASTAPTTSTAGAVGQLYVDTATSKTYHCTAVTVDDTDPQNPVTTYEWTDDINAKGGEVTTSWALTHPYLTTSHKFLETFVVNGYGLMLQIGGGYSGNTRQQAYTTRITAVNNIDLHARNGHIGFNTHAENTAGGLAMLQSDGTLKTPAGFAADITVIPAATTAYTLAEGCFVHAPESAPTYTLPAVTDSTRTHRIDLTVDFTTVQTYSFVDSEGTAIAPLFTPAISAGDIYTFVCEWSSLQSRWLIYPRNNNGKAQPEELPAATSSSLGAVYPVAGCGLNVLSTGSGGGLYVDASPTGNIDNRNQQYRPIVPSNLNYAVTAALTDANHITLTDAQKTTAQSVIGATPATLELSAAPTGSTAGVFGQHAIDMTTGKEYTCQGSVTEDDVTTYTWVDVVNAKGGTFNNNIEVTNGILHSYLSSVGGLSVGMQNDSIYGGSIQGGYGMRVVTQCQLAVGKWNRQDVSLAVMVGNGTSNSSRKNVGEISWEGDLYHAGGYQQGITEIPAATSAYTLAEGCFVHAPESAPTYTLPAVTDATRTHRIDITVDFTSVQSYAFQDSSGTAVLPLFSPRIDAGTVVTFECEWSAVKSQWLIYPKNSNGKIEYNQLKTSSTWGFRSWYGGIAIQKAENSAINSRSDEFKPIVPNNLNYAVTAALTDTNHITLTSAQQAVAQQVLGVSGGGGGGGGTDENTAKEIALIYG